jgi:hypothetical protein
VRVGLKGVSWVLVAGTGASHAVLVIVTASAVTALRQNGEPGYLLWRGLILLDAPVYYSCMLLLLPLAYISFHIDPLGVGSDHVWGYHVPMWVLLIGGSLQWMLIVKYIIYSLSRLYCRRMDKKQGSHQNPSKG